MSVWHGYDMATDVWETFTIVYMPKLVEISI